MSNDVKFSYFNNSKNISIASDNLAAKKILLVTLLCHTQNVILESGQNVQLGVHLFFFIKVDIFTIMFIIIIMLL